MSLKSETVTFLDNHAIICFELLVHDINSTFYKLISVLSSCLQTDGNEGLGFSDYIKSIQTSL